MPPQSPAMRVGVGVVVGGAADRGVVVRREVDRIARGALRPAGHCPGSARTATAFCSLRVEPAAKTRVVLNGTEALPLVTPLLLPAGAWSTKVACVISAGDRIALGNARHGHDDDRTAELEKPS